MLVEELIEWLGCWAPYLEIRQESRSSGGVGKGTAVKLIQGRGILITIVYIGELVFTQMLSLSCMFLL